jgi:hypothetical protein
MPYFHVVSYAFSKSNKIDNVDDFLICYRGKKMNTIERQLQLCLNKIEKWAMENEFKFSSLKTVRMHFCIKRGLHPELKLYNSPDCI